MSAHATQQKNLTLRLRQRYPHIARMAWIPALGGRESQGMGRCATMAQ